jgi:polyhydroxybutyrate depolymerase
LPVPVPTSARPAPPSPGRLRRGLPAALAGLALLASACTASSADTRPEVSLSSQDRTRTLTVAGQERSYLLQPAEGLDRGDEPALVVVLHQEGGTPEGLAAETALQDLRARGATLVYPAGLDQSWDAGACCSPSKLRGADDIAFLDALFQDVPRQTPVDGTRRAMVGYSSGGMLTYRYVCGRPGKLDAAVVVSGSLETECEDGITTPDVMAVHGKKDGTIGFSSPIFIKALGLAPRPVEDSLEAFTRSAGCEQPESDSSPDLEVRRWQGCRGGTVEAQLVPEVGHGWVKLDATRRTREFLVDHLLDRAPR